MRGGRKIWLWWQRWRQQPEWQPFKFVTSKDYFTGRTFSELDKIEEVYVFTPEELEALWEQARYTTNSLADYLAAEGYAARWGNYQTEAPIEEAFKCGWSACAEWVLKWARENAQLTPDSPFVRVVYLSDLEEKLKEEQSK